MYNSALRNLLVFTVGAALGSAVTWKVLKEKYARIAQDEIDSVKEVYSRKKPDEEVKDISEETSEEVTDEETKRGPSYKEYVEQTKRYTTSDSKGEEEDKQYMNKPYVIPPEEFDELDYETVSLTYYADEVLADEDDNIIEDIDDIIGSESLETFGQYEDDSVFVRNDELMCDYEILLDNRNYYDIYPERR